MRESPLRLVKRYIEFVPREKVRRLARDLRGIYVLYAMGDTRSRFDVLYVGLARTGARVRLRAHLKKPDWTHFSIFEVWENIRDTELEELEGLFRHVYRKDAVANRLNIQKAYGRLRSLKAKNFTEFEFKRRSKTKNI